MRFVCNCHLTAIVRRVHFWVRDLERVTLGRAKKYAERFTPVHSWFWTRMFENGERVDLRPEKPRIYYCVLDF